MTYKFIKLYVDNKAKTSKEKEVKILANRYDRCLVNSFEYPDLKDSICGRIRGINNKNNKCKNVKFSICAGDECEIIQLGDSTSLIVHNVKMVL